MLGTVNKLGVLGTIVAAAVNLGCCASAVFGPLTGVLFAGGFLYRVPVAWQMPFLYGSLAVSLTGFGLGWIRHRRLAPVLVFLSGAAALLYPFYVVLDVPVLKIIVWLGFGFLLAAAGWDVWLSLRTRGCSFSPRRKEVCQ